MLDSECEGGVGVLGSTVIGDDPDHAHALLLHVVDELRLLAVSGVQGVPLSDYVFERAKFRSLFLHTRQVYRSTACGGIIQPVLTRFARATGVPSTHNATACVLLSLNACAPLCETGVPQKPTQSPFKLVG